jgi:hypothetical protein
MKLLSVIVTITDGEDHLGRCLTALSSQKNAPPLEIIVPVYPQVENVSVLRRQWPQIRFVEVEGAAPDQLALAHWAYDRRRATGLTASSGDLIAITEDHAIPEPGWCEKIAALHRQHYGVIGGAIEHSGSRVLNWAVYFCDFGRYQKPFPARRSEYISDINVSYKRETLLKCADLWCEFYHETAVHGRLSRQGETLWLTPDLTVHHDRGRLRLAALLPERFYWARVFAGRRAESMSLRSRLVYALLSPALPVLLLARRFREACRNRANVPRFVAATPAMVALLMVWACGEFAGYVTASSFSGNTSDA